MSEYKWKHSFRRWSPKEITNGDVINIMAEHGYDNDSMLPEKDGENTKHYEIEITVTEIKHGESDE